jgi:hypothetical protein
MVKNLSFYTEVPISLSEDKLYWYFDTGMSTGSPWPKEGWSSSNSHLPQVYRYIFPTRVYLVSEKGRSSSNNTYMGVQIYNAETNERICCLYEHVDTIKNSLYLTEKEAQEMMKYSLSELKEQHDRTVGKSLKKVESSLKALKPYV